MPDDELSVAISLRLTVEDKARLDALAKALPMKALQIARIALRLGMAEIERDPSVLFRAPTTAQGPAKP